MKRKFSVKQFLLAYWKGSEVKEKDIHIQLDETIAERKRILRQWEKIFLPKPAVQKKDVHEQLQETIAELKRERQLWMSTKNAA